MGRFINADKYPSTGQTLTGNNMFTYCGNNPVIRKDSSGELWHIVWGAAVGSVFGVATKMVTNTINGKGLTDDLITAGIAGAISGGLAASGVGLVGQIVGNAAISMANNTADQLIGISNNSQSEGFDFDSVLLDGVIGAIAGFAGGPGAGSKSLTKIGLTNIKRTVNTLTHKGIAAAGAVLRNGISYFIKNASYMTKPLIIAVTKSSISIIANHSYNRAVSILEREMVC